MHLTQIGWLRFSGLSEKLFFGTLFSILLLSPSLHGMELPLQVFEEEETTLSLEAPVATPLETQLAKCGVCQEEMPAQLDPIKDIKLSCGHTGHRNCLANYCSVQLAERKTPNCMYCRKPLTAEDTQQYTPKTAQSLYKLCVAYLFKDKDKLLSALIKLPDTIVLPLIEQLLKKENPLSRLVAPRLDPSSRACLQLAIENPEINITRGCSIWLQEPSLDCQVLKARVHDLIKQNAPLSDPVMDFLVKNLHPSDLIKRPLDEMLPSGLMSHTQAQQIASKLMNIHLEEVQPHHAWPQSFARSIYTTTPPQDATFNNAPFKPSYHDYPRRLTFKPDDVKYSIYLPAIGDKRCEDGRCPAAINNNKTLLAISGRKFSDRLIEVHRLIPKSVKSWTSKNILLIATPADFLKENDITFTFSSDDQWLMVENGTSRIYYKLPKSYLSGELTLEQIAFIRILQQAFCARHYGASELFQTPLVPVDIAMIHALLNCKVLDTLPESEKTMFTWYIKDKHASQQASRKRAMEHLHTNNNKEFLMKELSSYFCPGELEHLPKDLAEVPSGRFAKKICRSMLEVLKKEFSEIDFSAFDFGYKGDKEEFALRMKKNIQDLCTMYVTLKEKKGAEAIKESLTEFIWAHAQQCQGYM